MCNIKTFSKLNSLRQTYCRKRSFPSLLYHFWHVAACTDELKSCHVLEFDFKRRVLLICPYTGTENRMLFCRLKTEQYFGSFFMVLVRLSGEKSIILETTSILLWRDSSFSCEQHYARLWPSVSSQFPLIFFRWSKSWVSSQNPLTRVF